MALNPSLDYRPLVPARIDAPEPPAGVEPLPVYVWVPVARKKFQHTYWIHALLLLLTVGSTWMIGGGLYSFAVLTILGAHEFGHYLQCRRYNVDATLPFFIPAPFIGLAGTFGAVIRIREHFPSKRALFDIGVSGPIAGFVALLPFLWFGIRMSHVAPVTGPSEAFYELGDPLIVKAFVWLHFGSLPANMTVFVHPLAFAAWWGLLATALNLLPFGQFDGGHIWYALFGRRASLVSMAMIGVAAVLTVWSLSWISVTVMMLLMTAFFGIRHPKVIDEHVPLDGPRRLVAFLALVIFVISFTPIPIHF